jgi:hypothetical protein
MDPSAYYLLRKQSYEVETLKSLPEKQVKYCNKNILYILLLILVILLQMKTIYFIRLLT